MSEQFDKIPTAHPVFWRTYSRMTEAGTREGFDNVTDRTVQGLKELGDLTDEEVGLIDRMQRELKTLPSGRWMWVGGTEWIKKPENYPGSYNCSSSNIDSWEAFGLMMDLAMQGCGTGAVLEDRCIGKLPPVLNKLSVRIIRSVGVVQKGDRQEKTTVEFHIQKHLLAKELDTAKAVITVGDSRQGWVDAYVSLLELASREDISGPIDVEVDLGNVRPAGEKLKGFGGTANPIKLEEMFGRVVKILNRAIGRKLTSVECCLLIDEAAACIVAGNIRRSAGMRQFNSGDEAAAKAKDNLWQQGEDGQWRIDPDRDALRMANHTRVFHHKPSREDCVQAVTKQFYSGEGAIQWAGEAVARASADIINTPERKEAFIRAYEQGKAREWFQYFKLSDEDIESRLGRYGLNPCFAEGTMILTRKGHYPIESLVGKDVEIWDGSQWVEINNFRITGENQPVYKLTLHDGSEILATPYHSFVLEDGNRKELKDLQPGDRLLSHSVPIHGIHHEKAAYLKGFLVGDGTAINERTNVGLAVYEPKYMCLERLLASGSELQENDLVAKRKGSIITTLGVRPDNKRQYIQGLNGLSENLLPWVTEKRKNFPIEIFNWDLPSKLEFIAGYMDADGTASDTKNGFLYQVTSIHPEWLKGFQALLKTIGVYCRFAPERPEGVKDFGDRGGLCQTKANYRLTISQISSKYLASQVLFSRLQSFADKKISYRLAQKRNRVDSIEFSHVADKVYCCTVPTNHQVALTNGIVTGQCGEILLQNNFCNLSEIHLNRLNPLNLKEQEDAFKAGALSVACLLNHRFTVDRYQKSRELDPIVGVSYTGLFDFFVTAFGVDWLRWWEAGRPEDWNDGSEGYQDRVADIANLFPEWDGYGFRTRLGAIYKDLEQRYFTFWRKIVFEVVWDYCDRHNLKRPNRCTTGQPAGSKSLLTGASNGFHAPKAARFIRRITFAKDDPVAKACIDYGYSVVPSQSDKDENGVLLNDPFDPRCTEWLVEIPVEVPWANLSGADRIDLSKFSALAQMDFYLQVQRYYVTHSQSATIELRDHEIEPLANRIYQAIQNDEGYISAALLARFDDRETFPRLPYEPIDKETYDRLTQEMLARRKPGTFQELLAKYDRGETSEAGPAPCESDRCMFPLAEGK